VSGVLLLGGTSEIGLAIARALAADGAQRFALAGRDPDRLSQVAERLGVATGAQQVETLPLQASDTAEHARLVADAAAALGGLEVVVLAVGILGDRADADPVEVLEVNALGAGSLLLAAAGHLRRQGSGALVVLSSAAAVRPRRSNPAYGASKAALDALALATGDRLHGSGARVLVVRPGQVRTRMTAHLPDAPLTCEPAQVGEAVRAGLGRGRRVVWVPGAMGVAMLAVRLLPAAVFRRLPW
jgi:decaprenylphospho-beta-D-erythro-pentofuranosid-2-ulose 2-reductase